MKLVTFEQNGHQNAGAWTDDGIVNLTASGRPELATLQTLIEGGEDVLTEARIVVDKTSEHIDPKDVRLLAPLPQPIQMRDCLGFELHLKNSAAAAVKMMAAQGASQKDVENLASSGNPLLDLFHERIIYYKANRFAVCGPDTDVVWPSYSKVMDFELEMACIIGKKARNVSKEDATPYIFGYTIFNDFSARDAQMAEQQAMMGPCKGKDFDNANVLGPVITTADEIGNPYDLKMRARINGETLCDSSSNTMHWRFEDFIAHISQDETLYPGEILGSGTVGWGCGLEHLKFLNDGDVVELEIEKIGVLRNRVCVS